MIKKLFLVGLMIWGIGVYPQYSFIEKVSKLKQDSWVSNVYFQGVTSLESSYRATDMSISDDGSMMIISLEDGGLWFSDDRAASFRNIFSKQVSQHISALAVNWKTLRIWVSTNAGIFFSDNIGETWQYAGLYELSNVTSMVCSKSDNNTLWVAAMGDKYKADDWRGVFKTVDAGKNWQKTLFVNNTTGVNQILLSEDNLMYAVSWSRVEKPWFSDAVGKNSGIYKSEDLGQSWTLITTENSGFAKGDRLGRIILSEDDALYALVDNRNYLPVSKHKKLSPKYDIVPSVSQIGGMSTADFLKMSDKRLQAFIYANDLQHKYTAQTFKDEVLRQNITPGKLIADLEILPDSIPGAELYKSNDKGLSWQKIESIMPDIYYKSGHKFGDLLCKDHKMYIAGVPLLLSDNEGGDWRVCYLADFSSEIEHIWKSPFDQTLFISTSSQILYSTDEGKSWNPINLPVYKNNGVTFANGSLYVWSNTNIYQYGEDQSLWQKLNFGGQSMAVSSKGDLFISGRYGRLTHINPFKAKTSVVREVLLKSEILRFNEYPPVELSVQNPDIVYWGSNRLHISIDGGKSAKVIQGDLTLGKKNSNLAFGTLTSISASALDMGLLYTASDDGKIFRSDFMGGLWVEIYKASSNEKGFVKASMHNKNRVFVSLYSKGRPQIFKSNNKGASWVSIVSNLPSTGVHFICEDKRSENILYAGTDIGLFVSFDKGEIWHIFSQLPQTSVKSITFNAEGNRLWVSSVLGVFSADISYFDKLNAFVQNQKFHPLSEVVKTSYSDSWGNTWSYWNQVYSPKVEFPVFASDKGILTVSIIKDEVKLKTFSSELNKGFNLISYDLTEQNDMRVLYHQKTQKIEDVKSINGEYYLPKGNYRVEFLLGSTKKSLELIVN